MYIVLLFVFQDDFDVKHTWLDMKETKDNEETTESICKSHMNMGENNRIIIFSTNACLRIMAEARGLSLDCTFKSAPDGWSQIMIICAEVVPTHWVPVMFIWLPNKKRETYDMAFMGVKNCLKTLKLKLSALYCIMDFEVGLRDSFKSVFGKKISLKGK